jgi:hypothetical protein
MIVPSRQRRLFGLLICASVLPACTNTPTSDATGVVGNSTELISKTANKLIGGPLIPNVNINVGSSVSYPLEKLVYWSGWVGIAYKVLSDPNWEIDETRFPENHMHFQLSMKRFYSGGAGEARLAFHRRAKELMRAGGFNHYEIVEYSEGMDSSPLGAKRTAEGVVRFSKIAG